MPDVRIESPQAPRETFGGRFGVRKTLETTARAAKITRMIKGGYPPAK